MVLSNPSSAPDQKSGYPTYNSQSSDQTICNLMFFGETILLWGKVWLVLGKPSLHINIFIFWYQIKVIRACSRECNDSIAEYGCYKNHFLYTC